MKKITFTFLLFYLFVSGVEAQYHLETLKTFELWISNMSKVPKPDEVVEFKSKPVVFVKFEMTDEIEKRFKSKDRKNFEANIEVVKEVGAAYNAMLEKIVKYYPYDVEKKIVTLSEYNLLFYKDKYAFFHLRHGEYLACGIMNNREKAFYALPFDEKLLEPEVNLEAEFKFFFQRMENYFKRAELGSPMSKKVYKKANNDLDERLVNELKTKTLLIDKADLSEDLEKSDISKLLDIKFELVDREQINDLILNPNNDYWYLKIIPYDGFTKIKEPFAGQEPVSYYDLGVHYIVDPLDGSALFVERLFEPLIDEGKLKAYNGRFQQAFE